MNEQLQKFYRQSIEYTNTDECLDMPNKQVQRLILTKYAELIVQKCMDICQELVDDGLSEAETPKWMIKEHFFGVEE